MQERWLEKLQNNDLLYHRISELYKTCDTFSDIAKNPLFLQNICTQKNIRSGSTSVVFR